MTRAGAVFAVEVRCAVRHRQEIAHVRVSPGETVADAIQRSGILARFLEVDPARVSFAIHGARVEPDKPLLPGDRVDVLRPLAVDPRQARRRRARKIAADATGAADRCDDSEQPLSAVPPAAAGKSVPRP